jgi:hypothetical protein
VLESGSGPGGRRFKSSLPDQSFQTLKLHFWFSVYIDGVEIVDGRVFLGFQLDLQQELHRELDFGVHGRITTGVLIEYPRSIYCLVIRQVLVRWRNSYSGKKVRWRSTRLTVLACTPQLASVHPAFATNVCPAWRVLTTESVKDAIKGNGKTASAAKSEGLPAESLNHLEYRANVLVVPSPHVTKNFQWC